MAWETYDDSCPGCQPVLIDVLSGKKLPDDDPAVLAMAKIWASTTLPERQAFHRVTCLNSKAIADLAVVHKMMLAFVAEGQKL
jgi:hypothetical protein